MYLSRSVHLQERQSGISAEAECAFQGESYVAVSSQVGHEPELPNGPFNQDWIFKDPGNLLHGKLDIAVVLGVDHQADSAVRA